MLFDAEAEQFRRAGIRIGVDISKEEEALLQEALAQFGIKRRNDALEMARLYRSCTLSKMSCARL